MNCPDVRELIVETLSGTTPPDLRRAVEAHLASCAACRAEAEHLEETARALRSIPDARLRDEYWPEFMARLAARLATERDRPWNRIRRWLRNPRHAWSTAGATAALIVALGAAWLLPAGPAAQPDLTLETSATVVRLLSPQVVERMPAMNASLAVWKAGLGTGEVSYDLTGGP
jgi:anti-sigma factor RsiW